MKKLLSIAIALLCCICNDMQAQDVPFNGFVKDVLGNPLKRVKAYVDRSSGFTYSNKKGQFGLTNVQSDDTLHLVYKRKQYDIPVNGRRSLSVMLADQLQYSAQEDEELIDLGMGYVKRREYNSPYSGISGDELVRQGYTSIPQALIGRVPGVSMQGGTLVIRGISSLNLSNEPLYVVDNVVVRSLDMVNLHDVDKIVVLKDGAMYGSRGANGVIVVTTKRGEYAR